MESPPSKATQAPSRKGLENYSASYVGAYLNTIKKERPGHLPVLARNQPCEIEVVVLPNECFCMLFERADKQTVTIVEKPFTYVESKVMSGVAHMVGVYLHEGSTVADAIAKGKKDALRDMRALEDSDIAKAVNHLERVLDSLAKVEAGNKSTIKMAEMELKRLQPIKNAIANSGPEVDMLGLVDALKNYPSAPVEVNIDLKEKVLLEKMLKDMGDLSDLIRRAEEQDKKLEDLEKLLKKSLSEYTSTADERLSKGLSVMLSSVDSRIENAIADYKRQMEKDDTMDKTIHGIDSRLDKIEQSIQDIPPPKDNVSGELLLAVADLRENMKRANARLTRIEEWLVKATRGH
jgi:hypothetical protein